MDQPLDRVPDISALDRELDRVLAGVAGKQHGIVSRRQLLALGFTRHEVQDRLALLADADTAEVDGIPVTSLAWTVVDYAAIANQRQVRLLLEALERRRIYIGRELDELLERTPNRKGVKTLRNAIAEITGPAPWLQSVLEEAFHELTRGSGLPGYEANVLVEGERVDALWREQRVIVELDGFAFHKSRAQFEADRRRDAKLQVAGYRVLRITQQRLHNEPDAVLADINELLSAARAAWAAAGR